MLCAELLKKVGYLDINEIPLEKGEEIFRF